MIKKNLAVLLALFIYLPVSSVPLPISPPPARDGWLVLTLHDGKYACVTMGDYRIAELYRGNAWQKRCLSFRYDEFSRLSVRKNDKEWCLSMPNSITTGAEYWDYALFNLCVVGEYKQIWSINSDETSKHFISNTNTGYRLLDFNWKLYLSNSGATSFKNYLADDRGDVKALIAASARPATYSVPLKLQWNYQGRNYELFLDDIHGANYHPDDKTIRDHNGKCLKSNLDKTAKNTWAYTSFTPCPAKELTGQYQWNIIVTSERNDKAKYEIWDDNNNQLAVTRYGSEWDVPFVASVLYVYTSKADKLVTQFDSVGFYKDAIRQINKSYANAANQCKLKTDCKKHKIFNRMQPSPYNLLNPEWLDRFWQIATTTNQSSSGVGFCGICALHTMEMISEVIAARFTRSPNPPVTPSFIQLAAHTNPFTHLRLHYPRLMDRLEAVSEDMALQVTAAEGMTRRELLAYFTSAHRQTLATFIPHVEISLSSVYRPTTSQSYWDEMYAQAEGTLWSISYSVNLTATEMARHVVMAYRGENGIHIMPTNMNIAFEQYSFIVRHSLTSGEEFLAYLLRVLDAEVPSTSTFHGLIISRIGERIASDEYSNSVSFGDCLGAGPGRRGNGRSTNATILNSCAPTGRCVIQ